MQTRFVLSVVFAALVATAPNSKADVLPLNTWESFRWSAGRPPSHTFPSSWTFIVPLDFHTQLRVTDSALIGNEFSVTITSFLLNTIVDTSPIDPALDGVFGGAATGPASWANPEYSHVAVDLPPGRYSVSIDVIRNTFDFPLGFVEAANVPEPGSIGFLVPILLGAAFAVRRRFS